MFTTPKKYGDNVIEYEVDLSSVDLKSLMGIINSINPEALNVDTMFNVSGIPLFITPYNRCFKCHNYNDPEIVNCHFVVERKHKMKTFEGQVSKCINSKCDVKYLTTDQARRMINAARRLFR